MEENKELELPQADACEASPASEPPQESCTQVPISAPEEQVTPAESLQVPDEAQELPAEEQGREGAEAVEDTVQESVAPWDFGGALPQEPKQMRERSRGKGAFFGVFSAVLAVCLALLITLTFLGENGFHIVKTIEIFRTVYTKTDDGSSGLLTPQQAADVVSRSTVTVVVSTVAGMANGSGFVYDDQGHICTNYHVIQNAKHVQVVLADGTVLDAEIVGYDAPSDLAVLKADPQKLTPASVGFSNELLVGDDVVVVGTPLGMELAGTTTFGKVSCVDRWLPVDDDGDGTYEKKIRVLQTDTAVNPGNSGGPMADMYGRIVGVVVRKMTGKEAIGFAIPIDGARTVLNAIIEDGVFTGQNPLTEGRSLVGVTGHGGQKDMWYCLDEQTGAVKSSSTEREGYHQMPADGVYVISVDGANAKGAFHVGDVIVSVNGLLVYSTSDLIKAVNLYRVGQKVSIGIWRDGAAATVEITLAEG